LQSPPGRGQYYFFKQSHHEGCELDGEFLPSDVLITKLPFQSQKRSQLFIRVRHETLSVAATPKHSFGLGH
jgi:hypothetical protein